MLMARSRVRGVFEEPEQDVRAELSEAPDLDDPAGFRKVLGELLLAHAKDMASEIKDDRP